MQVLDKIVAETHKFVEGLPDVASSQLALSDRDFLAAIQKPGLQVIAELKSASPSEGVIKADYNPCQIAQEYVQGGAAAISVLTDGPFFNGSFAHLREVRKTVDVPLLCKDFIIDRKQVAHARLNGANAVLLIMRILEQNQAQTLKNCIEDLGMLALVEIFDDADTEKAIAIDSKAILVNNRNLDSLAVNLHHTEAMLAQIPQGVAVVAASGMKTAEDVNIYPQRIHSVLVGTMLMKSQNPAKLIKEMIELRGQHV